MKKLFIFLIALVALANVTMGLQPAHAQGIRSEIDNQLDAAGGSRGAGLERTDPRQLAARIIFIMLSLVGIVILALMVYAGYIWMTAAGNEEQITEAKQTIRNCVIGLAIVLSAYSITWFVARVAVGDAEPRGSFYLKLVP